MAGEQRLRDAKITLKLDVQGARDALDKVPESRGGEGTAKSTPTGKPPSPGREGEQKEREEERREDRRSPRQRPVRSRAGGTLGAVAAARRAPRLVGAALKVIATAAALNVVASVVPAMIAKKLEDADDDSTSKEFLQLLKDTIGTGFGKSMDAKRAAAATAAFPAPFVRSILDVAKSNQALGLGLDASDIVDVGIREGRSAQVQTHLRSQFSQLQTEILARALLDHGETLVEGMTAGMKAVAAVNK